MFKLKIENRFGEVLELTHNKNYIVRSVEGLTPPTAKINLSDVAGMNGSLFNSARVETRNLVLTILPQAPVEKNRLALYKYAQVGQKVKIYYSNGSTNVRIEGYVETVEGSLFSRPQTIQISILCPQPYFESLSEMVDDISSTVSDFEFPFAIAEEGVEFSHITHDAYSIVTNRGNVETGLSIHITSRGRVVNPIIYDDRGGRFAINQTIDRGQEIVINTRSGERSVHMTSSSGTKNIINKVDANPTWFTLLPGENVFAYEAESGAEFLSIVFKHRTKFGGV